MKVKGYTTMFFSVLLLVIIPSAVKGCENVIFNCDNFLDYACEAPYIGWALANCKKRCNLCDHVPPGEGNCRDKLPNCADHLMQDVNFCGGIYRHWAIEVCQYSCDFCYSRSLEVDDIPVPVETINICEDMLFNCSMYPESACESPEWSLVNCPKRCHLCEELPLTCADKVPHCHSDICTGNYTLWARQYCPATCNLCRVNTTPKPPISSTIPTLLPRLNWQSRTLIPPMCNDLVSAGCYSYPDSKCLDKMWAIPRCRKRCNICGDIPDKCVDKTDCSDFGSVVLCTGYYRHWAKQYCPKKCGFCK